MFDTLSALYYEHQIKQLREDIEKVKQVLSDVAYFEMRFFGEIGLKYITKKNDLVKDWEGKRRQTYDHAVSEANGAYFKVDTARMKLKDELHKLIAKLEQEIEELKQKLRELEEK